MPLPRETSIERIFSIAIVLVLFSTGLTLAPAQQSASSESKRFIGTWQAQHEGKVFFIVRLQNSEALSGTVATGAINVDPEGHVIEVEQEAKSEQQITELTVSKARLLFKTRDESGESTEYEMTLIDGNEARLRLLDAPPEIKPFSLRRL